jgi:hypothetical protein
VPEGLLCGLIKEAFRKLQAANAVMAFAEAFNKVRAPADLRKLVNFYKRMKEKTAQPYAFRIGKSETIVSIFRLQFSRISEENFGVTLL